MAKKKNIKNYFQVYLKVYQKKLFIKNKKNLYLGKKKKCCWQRYKI